MNPDSTPCMIRSDEGEPLRLRPPSRSGQVTIKVDPLQCGSRAFSMGTQHLEPGAAIPVHLHESQEELLVIQSGQGSATLGEREQDVRPGTVIYVPEGTWHGVRSTGPEPL